MPDARQLREAAADKALKQFQARLAASTPAEEAEHAEALKRQEARKKAEAAKKKKAEGRDPTEEEKKILGADKGKHIKAVSTYWSKK